MFLITWVLLDLGLTWSYRLVFFRQIAASIYRKQKRWSQSIALSKQDRLFRDAIETAAVSGKEDVVEELLRYVS